MALFFRSTSSLSSVRIESICKRLQLDTIEWYIHTHYLLGRPVNECVLSRELLLIQKLRICRTASNLTRAKSVGHVCFATRGRLHGRDVTVSSPRTLLSEARVLSIGDFAGFMVLLLTHCARLVFVFASCELPLRSCSKRVVITRSARR